MSKERCEAVLIVDATGAKRRRMAGTQCHEPAISVISGRFVCWVHRMAGMNKKRSVKMDFVK